MFYYNLIDSVKHAVVEAKRGWRRERTLFHCTRVQWPLGKVCAHNKLTK